jgi:hypothetical protein
MKSKTKKHRTDQQICNGNCLTKSKPGGNSEGNPKHMTHDQTGNQAVIAPVEMCTQCRGTDVLVLRWVNPNTGEVSHKESGTEGLLPYCNSCNDTTNLILK